MRRAPSGPTDDRFPEIHDQVLVYRKGSALYAHDLTTGPETLLSSQGLLRGHAVGRGQTRALTHKIDQALRLLDRGKECDALAVMANFRLQVVDLEPKACSAPRSRRSWWPRPMGSSA